MSFFIGNDMEMVMDFLDLPDNKVDKSPYRSKTIRVRCYDQILLIHDAEVIDIDEYIKWVNDERKERQERRVERRMINVKYLIESANPGCKDGDPDFKPRS